MLYPAIVHGAQVVLDKGLAIAVIHRQTRGCTAHITQQTPAGEVVAQTGQVQVIPDGQDVFVGKWLGAQTAVIPTQTKPISIQQPGGHVVGCITLHQQRVGRRQDQFFEAQGFSQVSNQTTHG
jgi:hypothetical protein